MSTPTLYKTTIDIFTTYDPTNSEIVDLAQEATNGVAYCTRQEVTPVPARHLPDFTDGSDAVLDFFGIEIEEPSVTATFATDDGVHTFTFDVTDSLAESSDEEIVELRSIGWGGDYAADGFFDWYLDTVKAPRAVAARAHNLEAGVGFEVHLDVAQAEEWVRANRPTLALPVN